ncbi:helix-turn-helix domain-containing protein [Thermoactinomyces mirandus]|uniref:Helix-turn-helix transcriptional regulator n=1 Tax=Thermoactinomyces mirandus TaxID=2756294 RepID=A0A7W2AR48_9BACL|nr:helix-turn-helix transcriptional regulator [Thermoactinomyces mirandus]MBA4601957.1 helix-turn-helix transcriptional regulator [Thermoactinomyces mirandus]
MEFDRIEIGKFIKKTRKAKRLRQQDLADENISQVVISYIETGKPEISEEKIRYLLNKLKIRESDYKEFYVEDNKEASKELEEEMKLRLIALETIIDLTAPEQGLEELRSIGLPNGSPLDADIYYLKGKYYLYKRNLKRANKYFFQAIRLVDDKYPEMIGSNLKAASYFGLAKLEYANNDLNKALEYCKKGESSFIIDGGRSYLQAGFLVSKVIFLQKLNRLEDAQSALDKLNSLNSGKPCFIESREIILNAYELQATIWAKGNMTNNAIIHAKKGIELARIDKAYDRSCELWTTLGSIYSNKNKLHLAEICFLTALKLKNKIQREYLLSYANTQLGNLYTKKKKFSKAEKMFQKAISISKKTNDAYQETEALMGLGECYIHQNNSAHAIKCLKHALELAKQSGFTKQKNQLLLKLGHYLKTIGNPGFQEYVFDFFESNVEALFNRKGGESAMPYYFSQTKRHSAGDPPDL